MHEIHVSGAAIHNLKNINVTLPKGKFIVITGISGSGKSSLAFDILYEEGRKRYLQSIGFGSRGEIIAEQEPFDEISGLPPAIAVEQNKIRQSNPRSIVGTKTKALHDLKWLYAMEGRDERGRRTELSSNHYAFYALAADHCEICEGKGHFSQPDLAKIIGVPNRKVSKIVSGISAQLDKYLMRLERANLIDWRHAIYAELPEVIKQKVLWGIDDYEGIMNFIDARIRFTQDKPARRAEFERLWYSKTVCGACGGKRMGERARGSYIGGKDISELCAMTIADLHRFFTELATEDFTSLGRQSAARLRSLFGLFTDVGLSHLNLLRSIPTLSGGELQRLYLMFHLESQFDSLLYVFDEPTAGLHEREKESLVGKLRQLSGCGNTVIVVEHDRHVIQQADYIVELGPAAGRQGGSVVFQGTYEAYLSSKESVIRPYLTGEQPIFGKNRFRAVDERTPKLVVSRATLHNLKDIRVEIPLGVMVGISGVSGSGKSTLIMDTLVPLLKQKLEDAGTDEEDEDAVDESGEERPDGENPPANLDGALAIQRCVLVSQRLIGRSRASTPAAYIGIWDKIRSIFAEQSESVARGYTPSHFSFNLEPGQCPSCRGIGAETVDMGAVGIVHRVCSACDGRRYRGEVLEITFNDRTIWDVIEMNPVEALEHFREYKSITSMLHTLIRVGLDYLSLGQPITTISGGEAQRIKLAKELGKVRRGNTLYVLDEPTTGLGSPDIAKLMALLEDFVNQGNSVILIEHDQSVLSCCDWVIELGPGGGSQGGEIVSEGPPSQAYA